jgi:hypothetical protein
VRNHARDVLACDFFVTVTARFRLLYVFVVLDVGKRRLVHLSVNAHPTAEWTVQQFRTCVSGETTHRFVVHDRTPSTRWPGPRAKRHGTARASRAHRVMVRSILAGLHHEYGLETMAA